MMSRRAFLALGAVAAGMAATGTALLASGYRYWVLASLRKALPGYSFEPAGLDRFIDEYQARHDEALKFRLLGAAERVIDPALLLPEAKLRHIEDEERDLLTEFLLGSDFFQRHPRGGKEIAYNTRAVACRSPFARFDL